MFSRSLLSYELYYEFLSMFGMLNENRL